MRFIPTTETLAKRIKARGREISRAQGEPLAHGHDAAAREFGYDDFHHVTWCLGKKQDTVSGEGTSLEARLQHAWNAADAAARAWTMSTAGALDAALGDILMKWRKRPNAAQQGPSDEDMSDELAFHRALLEKPHLMDVVGRWYSAQMAFPNERSFALTAILEREETLKARPMARVVSNAIALGTEIGRRIGAKVTVSRTAMLCVDEPFVGLTLWRMGVDLAGCEVRSSANDRKEFSGTEMDLMKLVGRRYIISCLVECTSLTMPQVMSRLDAPGFDRGEMSATLGVGKTAQQHGVQRVVHGTEALFGWYDDYVFAAIAAMDDAKSGGAEASSFELTIRETESPEHFIASVRAPGTKDRLVRERIRMPLGPHQAIERNLGRRVTCTFIPNG